MTELQLGVYEYVRDFLAQSEGLCPSVQAISDAFHLRSKGRAKRVLDALVAAGKLRRTAARTRNLALPDAAADLTVVPSTALRAELERRGESHRRSEAQPASVPTRPCPASGCDGRVRKGQLLCREHWFSLPCHLRDELRDAQWNHHVADYQYAWQRACELLERVDA